MTILIQQIFKILFKVSNDQDIYSIFLLRSLKFCYLFIPAQIEPPILTVDLQGKFNHFFLVFSFLVILLLILFCVHLLPICPLLHRPRALGGSHINSYHLDTGS